MARKNCRRVALRKKQAYQDGVDAKRPSTRVDFAAWKKGRTLGAKLEAKEAEYNDY